MKNHIQNKNKFSLLISCLFFITIFSCGTNNTNKPKTLTNNTLDSVIIEDQNSKVNKFFDFTISDEYYELSKEEIKKFVINRGPEDVIKKNKKNLDKQRVFYKKDSVTYELSNGDYLGEEITILPSPMEPSSYLLGVIKSSLLEEINNNYPVESSEMINSGEIDYNDDIKYIFVITKTIEESITKYSHQYIIKIRDKSFIISIDTFGKVDFDDIFKIK